MRRGLAGLLFFAAAILLAIAAGGWWLQRVAFDPSTSPDIARAVLRNADVREELATAVADATAERLGQNPEQLAVQLNAYAGNPWAGEFLGAVVADVHARLIGAREEPVEITGLQMVDIVRNQAVAELPAVTLPVEEIPILNTIRTTLRWLVPIAALAGLAALVLGILAHPQRADAIFGIGVFCVLAAVLAFLLGYPVPAYAVPLLDDNPWLDVIPAVADHQLRVVTGLSVGLAVVGVVLILGSSGSRRRKTKGWSSPVTVSRYREQRRWS